MTDIKDSAEANGRLNGIDSQTHIYPERQLNRNPVELRLGDPDDPIILTGNLLHDPETGTLVLSDPVEGDEEILTIVTSDHRPDSGSVVVKDWSEHHGLAEALLATGLFARGGRVDRPGPTREITLTTHDLRVLPAATQRTRLSFHVEMDVEPHPDQSADSAADELAELFTQHLTDKRMPFFEDYGITPEDLAEARAHGEVAGFAGYDGPFAINTTVTRRTS